MQRGTVALFGLVVASAMALVILRTGRPSGAVTPTAAAHAQPAPTTPAVPSVEPAKPAPAEEESAQVQPGFDRLPDGQPVPPLPASAPKTVRFGVILVTYKGAEHAPKDAPSKEAALEKAKTLLAAARTDFADTVKKGDRGSTADAGRLPRGVLEPNVEYLLFTLGKGALYEQPIDTPRGFWIIKRTD